MVDLVSVLILNWNRGQETCRAIESVLKQSYSEIELIVVDNGSTDGSIDLIKSKFPFVFIVNLGENYGCPGGRNRGIKYCNGKYIFFCDNDGVLHSNAIENAVKLFSQCKDCVVLTGSVRDFVSEEEIDTDFLISDLFGYEVSLFQGGISMHLKSIYSTVGFYPDDYIYGGEESFLSLKILNIGKKIFKSNQIVLWHKKSLNARNLKKEAIQKWNNELINAYQLFPIEYFIIFVIYFVFRYPIYAFQHGFFLEFVNSFYYTFLRLSKYKRNPVNRRAYFKFRGIRKS